MQVTKWGTRPKKDAVRDRPPSEKKLMSRERIANASVVALVLICALLCLIGVAQTLNTNFFRPSPMVSWNFFIPAILAIGVGVWGGISYSSKCAKVRHSLYQELQEGTISGLIFDDETKYAGVVRVYVEGENRMGETRRQIVAISAKQWHTGKFVIGQKLKL